MSIPDSNTMMALEDDKSTVHKNKGLFRPLSFAVITGAMQRPIDKSSLETTYYVIHQIFNNSYITQSTFRNFQFQRVSAPAFSTVYLAVQLELILLKLRKSPNHGKLFSSIWRLKVSDTWLFYFYKTFTQNLGLQLMQLE